MDYSQKWNNTVHPCFTGEYLWWQNCARWFKNCHAHLDNGNPSSSSTVELIDALHGIWPPMHNTEEWDISGYGWNTGNTCLFISMTNSLWFLLFFTEFVVLCFPDKWPFFSVNDSCVPLRWDGGRRIVVCVPLNVVVEDTRFQSFLYYTLNGFLLKSTGNKGVRDGTFNNRRIAALNNSKGTSCDTGAFHSIHEKASLIRSSQLGSTWLEKATEEWPYLSRFIVLGKI